MLAPDEQPGFDAHMAQLAGIGFFTLAGIDADDNQLAWLLKTTYKAGFIAGGHACLDKIQERPLTPDRVELAGGTIAPLGTADEIGAAILDQTPAEGGR